jgi:FMN phosphatase YigB (HAD superfamily)
MTTLSASIAPTSHSIKTESTAADLIATLDQYGSEIKVLSLDCFDTILWRTTATPTDLFYNLQHRPAFHALKFAPNLRVQAEAIARKLNMIKHQHTETHLTEIYLTNFPELRDDQIENLIADELAEEIATCYAFPPLVKLILHAHAKGIKIIIASDTYLKEDQLRTLLASHLAKEAMQAIDQIFCSCDYKKSKRDGLFSDILKKTNVLPKSILHIGDNHVSDFLSAQSHGLHALHFLQHNDDINEILRMEALAGNLMDSTIRMQRGMTSPFRGLLSITQHQMANPETAIGFTAVGPILYTFAKFICAEIQALREQGKQLKVLFLMRDGHLPALVSEAIMGEEVGTRVRISRFVALAATFRTQKDIDRYLSDVVSTLRFHDICRQLLLPPTMTDSIVAQAENAGNYSAIEFIRLVQLPKTQKMIFEQSKAYRARLMKHLEKAAQIETGDTLMFVDLGYTGTAQIQLAPVLRDEMNIDVIGRYLIALKTPQWETNRRGLLDASWCDDRAMLMLVNYIALLEQICTSNESSVVDFDDKGNPIFSKTSLSKGQHSKLDAIQAECVRFAKEAEAFFQKTGIQFSTTMLRDAGTASLCRLLFIPTETELQHLQSFEFDLNMGTKDILQVFNREEGLLGLRRRGLFFMERNAKSMRTNYPAELRSAGLELSLILMTQTRYGLDIKSKDLSLKREKLKLIIIRGADATQTHVEALPTYEGYYALLIPVSTGNINVGIQFGLNYHWVQIESVDLIKASALLTTNETQYTIDASAHMMTDQMDDKGGGLFECLSSHSLLMLNFPDKFSHDNHVFRVVFRPVVGR